jgi:hypothetical protein
MKFEEALPLLREGRTLRRRFWPTEDDILKGKSNWTVDKFIEIKIVTPHDQPVMLARIYYHDSKTKHFKNCWVYGLPTRDLLADDWEVTE